MPIQGFKEIISFCNKKKYVIIIAVYYSISQCIDVIEPSCQCETSSFFCLSTELDGYTYGMSTYLHQKDGPDPMCTGSDGAYTTSHNPTWIAFVAECSEITLEVTYDNCITNTESCSDLGIETAGYSDCSLLPSSACGL